MKSLEFGPEVAARVLRHLTLARSVVVTSLFVAFGALLTAIWIQQSLEAHGDRAHLANPAGPEQTAALRYAGVDPTQLNPDATVFLGTGWLELVAAISGILAFIAGAWLCASTASRAAHLADLRLASEPSVRT